MKAGAAWFRRVRNTPSIEKRAAAAVIIQAAVRGRQARNIYGDALEEALLVNLGVQYTAEHWNDDFEGLHRSPPESEEEGSVDYAGGAWDAHDPMYRSPVHSESEDGSVAYSADDDDWYRDTRFHSPPPSVHSDPSSVLSAIPSFGSSQSSLPSHGDENWDAPGYAGCDADTDEEFPVRKPAPPPKPSASLVDALYELHELHSAEAAAAAALESMLQSVKTREGIMLRVRLAQHANSYKAAALCGAGGVEPRRNPLLDRAAVLRLTDKALRACTKTETARLRSCVREVFAAHVAVELDQLGVLRQREQCASNANTLQAALSGRREQSCINIHNKIELLRLERSADSGDPRAPARGVADVGVSLQHSQYKELAGRYPLLAEAILRCNQAKKGTTTSTPGTFHAIRKLVPRNDNYSSSGAGVDTESGRSSEEEEEDDDEEEGEKLSDI